MAVESVSELFSAVYSGLGMPEDQYLSKTELANILFRQLALRLESVRQSEQRIAIAKSTQFTLGANEDEKNLTTLEPDFVIPLWVERQTVNINSKPVWQFVPTVNLSQLQSRRAEAVPAVSFYGGDSTEVIAKFSYYGSEIAQPSRYTQVWYSKTVPFPQAESASLNLPDNLTNMVTLDCMAVSLPLMIVNASKYVTNTPSLAPILAAWNNVLLPSVEKERMAFEKFFELWRKGSRGGHRSRRRRDVLRRGNSASNWIFGVNNSADS